MQSGFHVVGFDIDPARRRRLARAGAEVTSGVARVGDRCEIIISSLPSSKALRDVSRRLAAAGRRARIVIETSTLQIGRAHV